MRERVKVYFSPGNPQMANDNFYSPTKSRTTAGPAENDQPPKVATYRQAQLQAFSLYTPSP